MADPLSILFVDILQMSSYPGAPFTGNPFQDLILFFFVPTVFMILIIFVAVGIVLHHEHTRMRLLLAIAMYLFVIAGGYFSFFAGIAGPYFIVLLFFIAMLFFIGRHFRRGGGGGPYSTRARDGGSFAPGKEHVPVDEGFLHKVLPRLPKAIGPAERKRVLDDIRDIDDRIRHLEQQIAQLHKAGEKDARAMQNIPLLGIKLDDLRKERQALERLLQLD